ncbi:hypothetical protein RFI_15242 [Reticulomyxa filosa]|uniref:Uncharacterized protein n=1 Tax=Reticulomyxa filosa TaxID=46433 RepID=X6N6S0_RETFI|nr:hypothetical protein RFI_15242 [Reticulomyxa filosa]|eukprot:ETO21960.1 hypothetical protein RFI_15242 [Reticulomyxa filosa]
MFVLRRDEDSFVVSEEYGFVLLFLAPNALESIWKVYCISISPYHNISGNNRVYVDYWDEKAFDRYNNIEGNVGLLGEALLRPVQQQLILNMGRLTPASFSLFTSSEHLKMTANKTRNSSHFFIHKSPQLHKSKSDSNWKMQAILQAKKKRTATHSTSSQNEKSLCTEHVALRQYKQSVQLNPLEFGIENDATDQSTQHIDCNSGKAKEQSGDLVVDMPSTANKSVIGTKGRGKHKHDQGVTDGEIDEDADHVFPFRFGSDRLYSNNESGNEHARANKESVADEHYMQVIETELVNDTHEQSYNDVAISDKDCSAKGGLPREESDEDIANNEDEEDDDDDDDDDDDESLRIHEKLTSNMLLADCSHPYLAKSACTPLQTACIYAGAKGSCFYIKTLKVRVYTLEESLKVGAIIDARDFTGKWYQAEVIKVIDHRGRESSMLSETNPLLVRRVKIHYLGYSANYDEWLDVDTDSHRIAQRGVYTVGPDLRSIRRHAQQLAAFPLLQSTFNNANHLLNVNSDNAEPRPGVAQPSTFRRQLHVLSMPRLFLRSQQELADLVAQGQVRQDRNLN